MDATTMPPAGGATVSRPALRRSLIELKFEDVQCMAEEVKELAYCAARMAETRAANDPSFPIKALATLCEAVFSKADIMIDFVGYLDEAIKGAR